MDDRLSGSNAAWRSIPLCCRYSLVRIERLPVHSEKIDVAPIGSVLWALGVLSDGQHEVLGAWSVPEPSTIEWTGVFEDLRTRGVERIGAVVSGECSVDTVALRDAYPSAASLGAQPAATPANCTNSASAQRVVAAGARPRQPGKVLRYQRMVQATDDAVRRLRTSAALAIARHKPFGELEAAQSFVIEKLRLAERKLGPFPLGASVQVHLRSRHRLLEMAG